MRKHIDSACIWLPLDFNRVDQVPVLARCLPACFGDTLDKDNRRKRRKVEEEGLHFVGAVWPVQRKHLQSCWYHSH